MEIVVFATVEDGLVGCAPYGACAGELHGAFVGSVLLAIFVDCNGEGAVYAFLFGIFALGPMAGVEKVFYFLAHGLAVFGLALYLLGVEGDFGFELLG